MSKTIAEKYMQIFTEPAKHEQTTKKAVSFIKDHSVRAWSEVNALPLNMTNERTGEVSKTNSIQEIQVYLMGDGSAMCVTHTVTVCPDNLRDQAMQQLHTNLDTAIEKVPEWIEEKRSADIDDDMIARAERDLDKLPPEQRARRLEITSAAIGRLSDEEFLACLPETIQDVYQAAADMFKDKDIARKAAIKTMLQLRDYEGIEKLLVAIDKHKAH